jgi:uncharacterized membrane protein
MRLIELILGLPRGFLNKDGDLFVQFNPHWPLQDYTGAAIWNILLAALCLALVLYVYRREARTLRARVTLAFLRALLLALVLFLLNRPILTLGQSRTEPSVVAVLIDDSVSMKVKDIDEANPQSRLNAALKLMNEGDRALLKELTRTHTVRLYRFDSNAQPILSVTADPKNPGYLEPAKAALTKIEPIGQTTQVLRSVRTVLDDLTGQRLAGVVILTDGRDTPERPVAEQLAAVKEAGAKIFPIIVGTDKGPRNVAVQTISVQDSAFKGDIVNVKTTVRATGYNSPQPVTLILKDRKTGNQLLGPDGLAVEKKVTLSNDQPQDVELPFKADEIGVMDVAVEAKTAGPEIDDEDNIRTAQLAVLDAKISVLFVDGSPRWDYRYLKNELIRDKTVDVSCLLTSADPTFAQEGDKPIRRFPESIEEMLAYDVVVFGDVDPRQFTDTQLALVADFVGNRGGGFGMVAGPRYSPQAFHNTAIEPILPVAINKVEADDPNRVIAEGFRPVLTPVGSDSSIFRFFTDRDRNEQFMKNELPFNFWYCRGLTVKPGVAEAYAEHPSDLSPDGRKAPIVVLGRFGAGRTFFSAIDDSWRWRFYTGESVFDTYWVQSLRYLARGKKLGQRRLTFASLRPNYELGETVKLNLRLLDPQLRQQIPDQLPVTIVDGNGQPVSQQVLTRQEGQPDLFVATFPADRAGRFAVKLPPISNNPDLSDLTYEIVTPRLELAQPQVDRTSLTRIASETLGQAIELDQAAEKLPPLLPSAARIIPVESTQPLWDAPIVLVLFVFLITTEWILRKIYGMV